MGNSVELKAHTTSTPIWQSENAEMYSSSPGIEKYVIWTCNPNDENVKKYPKFDALDPLPHHYYNSDEEHEKARQSYRAGIYPDKRLDLNKYFKHLEKKVDLKAPELVVFNNEEEKKISIRDSKAA